MYDFGSRVLCESSFGEDVLALQNFLADEGYYNPLDGGYTGYFGSVTKEALQAWQRDVGLPSTGVFDAASRWAYIKLVENSVRMYHRTEPLLSPNPAIGSHENLVFGLSAIVVGTLLVRGASKWLPTSVREKISSMAQMPNLSSVVPASNPQKVREGSDSQEGEKDAEPAIGETQRKSMLSRLSEEEVQRYIAPMKGVKSPGATRASLQRPPPKPLHLGDVTAVEALEDEGVAPPTKYGAYYGGKKVRERVKSFLQDQETVGTAVPSGGATQRMMALAFGPSQNGDSGRAEGNLGKSSRPKSAEEKKKFHRIDESNGSPVTQHINQSSIATKRSVDAGGTSSSFRDVQRGSETSNIPTYSSSVDLISGTELEGTSVRPMGYTSSQTRSSQGSTHIPSSNSDASVSANKAATSSSTSLRSPVPAPSPVKVVKPSHLGGENEERSAAPPLDPDATIILTDKPIKLHKPARLVSSSVDSDSEGR